MPRFSCPPGWPGYGKTWRTGGGTRTTKNIFMYRELFEAVRRHGGTKAAGVLRYMDAVHISDWSDLTRARLEDFKAAALRDVAKSTAHGYMTVIRGIATKYRDEPEISVPISQESMKEVWRERVDDTVKVALDRRELEALEQVMIRGRKAEIARRIFIVGAYTGMRLSDILAVTPANISGGALTYVSKKTGVSSTVPLRPVVGGYISWLRERADEARAVPRKTLNEAVKRAAMEAGIRTVVTVHRGDADREGEKWQFVTMHTARVSFCTNLARLGVPILDIAKMAGHRTIKQTLKYIVDTPPELTARQLAYFRD